MTTTSRRKKQIWVYILIALLSFITALLLFFTDPLQEAELANRDYFFEIRGPLSVEDSPIVLVAISDEADEEIPEKWPWPTSVHAKLVENLKEAGAKAILFDVIFSNRDIYDLSNDSLFAEEIRDHGGVVLAGALKQSDNQYGDQIIKELPNKVLLSANANPTGLVEATDDIDGFVRVYKLGQLVGDQSYYMLGLEGLRIYQGLPQGSIPDLLTVDEESGFKIGEYEIERNNLNSFIINYYGPEGMFPMFPYDQVIDDSAYTTTSEEGFFEANLFDDPDIGLLGQGVFKDKIVIVGSTMTTLQDFHPTPFSSAAFPRPGFEIHAHAIQTILDASYLQRQSGNSAVLIMLLLSFVIVFFNRTFGAGWGFAFMVLLMGGYYFLALQLFLKAGIFIHVVAVLLTIFISQVGTVGYEYINEQQEKRRIKGMFYSYVSPTLVDQMVESGEEPTLGGEDQYLTAFFSDIVSFSTFSEKLEPNELVTLINEYLTVMTDIINDQGGTLDKFIGDAIVAFYGAPVKLEDHALRACITSQRMQMELGELRKKWKKDNWPDIVCNMHHRIGLNTGTMVTGNMGSTRRFNYTMMGDNVNLAARCESGAKQYNVFTMVTEATKNEAEKFGRDCVFRLLDNIIVKGRSRPVKMYEIAGLRSEADDQLFNCVGLYERGMRKYFEQDWDAAIDFFEKSREIERYPMNPSQIFISRCNVMRNNPPGEDWDGVFVMKSK